MPPKKPTLTLLLSVLALPLCIFAIYKPKFVAYASENFSTECDVSYTIDENGETAVQQDITITNLTSRFFVSRYSLTIGSEDIHSVQVWDTTGQLIPEIERKDGGTSITFNLQARSYGTGKKLKFGVSYKFPGIASHNGLLWETNLPRIVGLDDVARYNLAIHVPNGFGPLLYATPQPKSTTDLRGGKEILYTKEELLKGPPRLAFGKFQLYQLQLTYHLENKSIALGYAEIAFPPDIKDQQHVVIKNISPSPINVRIDADGNYLARYNLGPREKKDIVWEGFVALFYPPREFKNDKAGAIPTEISKRYTTADKYWETDNPAIVAKAKELVDPNLPTAENAKNIFDFVSSYLSYNETRLTSSDFTRLGAASALNNKDKAVCMEYSDLFIALARAAGIPAREIDGYAYTADTSNRPLSLQIQGGDVLHAWAEFYLPETGWVMVDPTWNSTSGSDYFTAFDLSHITFAIKGISSEYPLPAGSYKTEPGQRDVRISLSTETAVVNQTPQLSIDIDFPVLSVSPLPLTAKVKIKNTSSTTAFNVKASFSSNLLNIDGTESVNLGTIPQGGIVETEVRLVPENFMTKGVQILSVVASANSFSGETLISSGEETTTVHPLYLPLPPPYLAGLIAITACSIWFNYTIIGKISNNR